MYFGCQLLAEGFERVYHEMDPEQKKQILDALGGYKNLPDKSTRELTIDSNKQKGETLGDKNLADKSTR